MKKRFLPGVAAACLLFASCSQDESVEMTGADEIRFSVATESQSRAAESFCANWLPGTFNVWAKTNPGNALYISGDVVANLGNGTFGYYGDNVRFWPKDGNLDFLAFSGDEGTFNQDLDTPQFVNYKVKDNPVDQLDLIYAVRSNVSKGNGTVALNFRHALSQVVFNASVSNPNLKVVVSNVKIGGLNNQGTYSLPAAETSENYLDPSHNDEPEDISLLPTKGVGSWSSLSGNAAYNVTAATLGTISGSEKETVTINYGETVAISSSYGNHVTDKTGIDLEVIGWKKVLNLIPQNQDAWTPGSQSGAYIALNCKIYSTEGDAEMLLNDNEWIYVPVAIDWKQGVRYVYTIDFGNGHAGWTGGPDDPNPQPTLGGVSVSCESVDDFAKLGGEPYTYRVHFSNAGLLTSGLEDIVKTDTRSKISVTIPNIKPEYPYYASLSAHFGFEVSQTSFKPTFYYWTTTRVDSTGIIDSGTLSVKSGRVGPGSSIDMPKYSYELKENMWGRDAEFVPVWNYQYNGKFHYHYADFGLAEPTGFSATNSGLNLGVGDPVKNGCFDVYPTNSSALSLPEGYEIVGFSRTYDAATKNINIEPEYPVIKSKLILGCVVPFRDAPIEDGKFHVELHAVYKSL